MQLNSVDFVLPCQYKRRSYFIIAGAGKTFLYEFYKVSMIKLELHVRHSFQYWRPSMRENALP